MPAPIDTPGPAADTHPARVTGTTSVVLDSIAEAGALAERGTPAEQADTLNNLAHAATLPREERVPLGRTLCQRCEVIPRDLDGPGTVHVSFPHTHTLGKALGWVGKGPFAHSRGDDGTLSVEVGPGQMVRLACGLVDLLSPVEREGTRVVFQPAGHRLRPADFFNMHDLGTFAARAQAGWLLDMLRGDRLFPVYQPIVGVEDRAVHGHEGLIRGRAADGGVVGAGPLLDSARRADFLFQLDMAARRAVLHGAAKHKAPAKLFVNFSPNSIYDPKTCLNSTVRLVKDLGFAPGRVVFEIVEADKLPEADHLKAIVSYYRDHGFGVALDDCGAGYASLGVLVAVRPDYVKIDKGLIQGVHADPAKAVVARKLMEAARELGAETVAEGVETAAEWDWVREHGADFAQGYHLAAPAEVPPAVPVG